MFIQSNVDKLLITNMAYVSGYNPHIWFNQKSIPNLIFLKNITNEYHVIYDSLYAMFIVHQEQHGKHNIHFIMHESGLHYYDPED